MQTLEKMTIGEYVAKDFRTAAVFSKYGIDFCCKGNRTIEEACEKKDNRYGSINGSAKHCFIN